MDQRRGDRLLTIDYATYWSVLPVGIAVATVAMSTGIDGAAFWAPVLLLGYGIEPHTAVACGVLIEFFGFGSGTVGYAGKKKIMYGTAGLMLSAGLTAGMLGALISKQIPPKSLVFIMGTGCAFLMYYNAGQARAHAKNARTANGGACPDEAANSPAHRRLAGLALGAIGGFFTGTIGVGLGITNNYYFHALKRYPVPLSSGTSVFIIAITAFFTSLVNLGYYGYGHELDVNKMAGILIFAIPAVILGAQAGVKLSHVIDKKRFCYFAAVVFSAMALIAFYRVFFVL
ncbi:MAG: sulfite exporter TauE/SafE family protein [Nitrospirae bacterium]|nr:sulfite exporter TauE/SafE family protein [Nitrospirota bacterium]